MIQRYDAFTGHIEPSSDGDYVLYEDVQPRAWFVKDFADGWIYFDNEADALREVAATGALMLVGYAP